MTLPAEESVRDMIESRRPLFSVLEAREPVDTLNEWYPFQPLLPLRLLLLLRLFRSRDDRSRAIGTNGHRPPSSWSLPLVAWCGG